MNPRHRPEIVQDLRDRIRGIEGHRQRAGERAGVSTGFAALDQLLADGGLKPGTLTEWLGDGEGSGVATLALTVAAHILRGGGVFVVIDEGREFYPAAAAHLGIPLDRTVVVRPDTPVTALWAWEQSLRCSGVAVTFGHVAATDERLFRRFQLGVEAGGGLGLVLRPPRCRPGLSWAATRIHVQSVPDPGPGASLGRRWQVRLTRGLHGAREALLEVELDHETSHVPLAAELAHPAEVGGPAVGSTPGAGPVRAGQPGKNPRGCLLPRRAPARRDARDAAG